MSAVPSIAELSRSLSDDGQTARSLATATLERIHAVNPQLHAFISILDEPAIAAAADSDARRSAGKTLGPLDGIPLATKDNIAVAGVATTNGTAFYKDRIATQDAAVVTRLRAAGAVIVGTLNMHEGALGATTDNPFWGRCDNPAAPGHTPGGSSGGSAAAVAAGLVPVALGTDTMGSTRIPAAYCGNWGLKPTKGLVPSDGLMPLSWTLDTIGPIASTPEDLFLVLNVIAGAEPRDGVQAWPELPKPHELVLGVPDYAALAEGEPEILAAMDQLQARLRAAGVTLRPVAVDGWEPGRLRRAGLLICEAEAGSVMGADLDSGRPGFSDEFRKLLNYGRQVRGEQLASAYRLVDNAADAAARVVAEVDAVLLPTTPQRAFHHGAPVPANQADFTALANIAGLPAVAFPLASEDDRPVSAQLMGRKFSDGPLVALAKLLSEIDRG